MRRDSRIWPFLLLAAVAVLSLGGTAEAEGESECLASRYLVEGSALLVGDMGMHEPIAVAGGLVSIGTACAPAPARYRFRLSGILVRATWKHCAGLRGRVKLKATILPGCTSVTGRLRARRLNRTFSARLSTCGDRIVDAAGGEQCDGGGCGAGFRCSACTCLAVSTTTTSTTVTTTTSSSTTTTEPPGVSVARLWDEEILGAIRRDTPRPNVHARNLFYLSVAMWDAWAVYDQTGTATQYITAEPLQASAQPEADRMAAISYAAYRVLKLRYSSPYANSTGAALSQAAFDARMDALGYDRTFTSTSGDSPAAVGNRIAAALLIRGAADGANEPSYGDPTYFPANDPLVVKLPNTVPMTDANRWQPLALDFTVTQNGIPIPDRVQAFTGSQWNDVRPWALVRSAAGRPYRDPGPPALAGTATDTAYKANFLENVRLSSLLDPSDATAVDLSPGVRGANTLGTNDGTGHPVNPATGQPYGSNVVRRSDWARVIAEFWAVGPGAETAPGHWNVIANAVTEALGGARRFRGTGPVLSKLEWDVKLYLALNGTLHDAAIASWSSKRYYDHVRPISAIRNMAYYGQSSDPGQSSYDPRGLPLEPGLVEVITTATTKTGQRHAAFRGLEGQIAVRAWPGQPNNPLVQTSGVRWVLGLKWVPYQKNTFVTPAFPGYVSEHSTFSRSAAGVLTSFTGSPYFPGGLAQFVAPINNFLTTELGPTATVTLQWATYYDAADEAGLSEVFGGLHAPEDDFAGRVMGAAIGTDAFARALRCFEGTTQH